MFVLPFYNKRMYVSVLFPPGIVSK